MARPYSPFALAIGWLQSDGHTDFLDDALTSQWLYGKLHRANETLQTTLCRVDDLQPPELRSVEYLPGAATVERRLQGFEHVHGEIRNGEVWQDGEVQLFALSAYQTQPAISLLEMRSITCNCNDPMRNGMRRTRPSRSLHSPSPEPPCSLC